LVSVWLLSATVLDCHRGGSLRVAVRRAVVVGAALLTAGCGAGLPDGEVGAAQVTVPVPATIPPGTGPAAPATPVPATEPPRPLKVLMAGDSMMGGLAPALKALLNGSGQGDVRFKLTPVLHGDPTLQAAWARELPMFDPDYVVMFVGFWETVAARRSGYDVLDPVDRTRYEAEVLDPWVRFITSYGARVVWIRHSPVGSLEHGQRLATFEPLVAALPERWPEIRLFPSISALNGTDEPTFHDTAVGPDGVRVRTRQVDGFHLCPDGAVRLAAALAGELGTTLPGPPGWETGPWRNDPVAFPPGKCLAV
jgi:hypothetical protein